MCLCSAKVFAIRLQGGREDEGTNGSDGRTVGRGGVSLAEVDDNGRTGGYACEQRVDNESPGTDARAHRGRSETCLREGNGLEKKGDEEEDFRDYRRASGVTNK